MLGVFRRGNPLICRNTSRPFISATPLAFLFATKFTMLTRNVLPPSTPAGIRTTSE